VTSQTPDDASDQLLEALRKFGTDGNHDQEELLPHILEAARATAGSRIHLYPAFVTREELESAIYERVVPGLRKLDPNMSTGEMMKYIYKLFDYALRDEGRANDLLPKRTRARVNQYDQRVEEFKDKSGEEPTYDERRELARECLGTRAK
jgi:hypothetical protein